MKQKKLLVWGVVLTCVMLFINFVPVVFYGELFSLSELFTAIFLPVALCSILAGAAYRKRKLGIVGSSVMVVSELLILFTYWIPDGIRHIVYFRDGAFLFVSLVVELNCLTVAILWFLCFVRNRPAKTLLIVVSIVGVALSGTISSINMLRMVVSVAKGYDYFVELLPSMLSCGVYVPAFWLILLLAACAQTKRAAKPAPKMAKTFAEPLIEPETEIVPAEEEETVPLPAQEKHVPSADAVKALKQLAALHKRGILTDSEYEAKKAELLSRI